MRRRNSLYEEMKRFQEEKKAYFFILLALGIVGLVFPVIPGLLLIGLAIALISPRYAKILQEWVQRIFDAIAASLR